MFKLMLEKLINFQRKKIFFFSHSLNLVNDVDSNNIKTDTVLSIEAEDTFVEQYFAPTTLASSNY